MYVGEVHLKFELNFIHWIGDKNLTACDIWCLMKKRMMTSLRHRIITHWHYFLAIDFMEWILIVSSAFVLGLIDENESWVLVYDYMNIQEIEN